MSKPTGSAAAARQRTAEQRKSKDQDGHNEEVEILDDQQQAAEIKKLKRQNRVNNERAANMLDTGVVVILILSCGQLLRYFEEGPRYMRALSMLQTALLPLSLSPGWLPRFASVMRRDHQFLVLAQLVIFALAFNQLFKNREIAQIFQWALPEVISGAVEIQRRGERDTAKRLKEMEGLTYNVKGA